MVTFKEFIASNSNFWRRENRILGNAQDVVLIDASVLVPHVQYPTIKIGLIFARLRNLRPLAYPNPRLIGKNLKLLRSMCPQTIAVRRIFLRHLLVHFIDLLQAVFLIKTKEDIINFQIDGVLIGPLLYDRLLMAPHRVMIQKISFAIRFRIIYQLVHFYIARELLEHYPVKLVIVADSTNCFSFLYQLCQAKRIECVCAIDANSFQMYKCRQPYEFEQHCRAIDKNILERISNAATFQSALDAYFEKRFSGFLVQHDVIRAYSSKKHIYSKEELYSDYNLNEKLPLVVIMAHAFTDFPHGLSGLLFADYGYWFIETVKALRKNKNVNLLAKEHPSVSVFREDGVVANLLRDAGYENRLLKEDTHTLSILRNADYVVTCGGTIGLEFSTFGKPVVLASRTPYSGLGFTVEPATADEYLNLLADSIQSLPRLTTEQILCAKKAAYVMFELYDNYDDILELGAGKQLFGTRPEPSIFFERCISQNHIPLEQQNIYRQIAEFDTSGDTRLINKNKILGMAKTINKTIMNVAQ